LEISRKRRGDSRRLINNSRKAVYSAFFSFFVYAGQSAFGLRLGKGRNTAEIAQKQQAEGGKIK